MSPFVAIDFETADAKRDSACAVGIARVEGCVVVHRASWLIRPPRPEVSPICYDVHKLSWDTLKDEPRFEEIWPEVLPSLDGAEHLVAHNATFDKGVMTACCRASGLPVPALPWICTVELSRQKWKGQNLSNKLPEVCKRLGIALFGHHEASRDAMACAQILIALQGRKKEVGRLCECGARCQALQAGLCPVCFMKFVDTL